MKTNQQLQYFLSEVIYYYKMPHQFNISFSGGKITVLNVHIVRCITTLEMLSFLKRINQGNIGMSTI